MRSLPRWSRVAAYAVILREGSILLSRLSPRLTAHELWTLPGGGLDHGENPRDAVVREIYEETGLRAEVGETARVYSLHAPDTRRRGRRVNAHSLRIVYSGWVSHDAPPPRVVEVNGSTVDCAWVPVSEVVSGARPVVPLVLEALADHEPFRMQRTAAHALIRRGAAPRQDVLLVRCSGRGFHTGRWSLPGGGIDHGERPLDALAREIAEETGVEASVGRLIGVYDDHFSGTAPSGRFEDYHVIDLLYEATVDPSSVPRTREVDGTTDTAAWVPVQKVLAGRVPVVPVVARAVDLADGVTRDEAAEEAQ